MCMLFIKPKDFTLPKNYFESLKSRNSNGLAMYNKATGEVFKTLDYKEGFEYLNNNHDSEIVCHFRYATSGEKSIDQVHGWEVCKNEYILFHNGVLSTIAGDGWKVKNARSDTQVLVHLFQDEPVERLVAYLEKFETGSRFLLVNKETREYIIPNCAKWNGEATFENDVKIQFSNNYAIGYGLLDGGYKWGGYGSYDDYDDYGIGYSNYGTKKSNVNTRSRYTGNSCSIDNKTNNDAKDSSFYNTLFKASVVDVQIQMLDLLWQGDFDGYEKLQAQHPDVDVHQYTNNVSTKTAS